jgi:hypothetical protein
MPPRAPMPDRSPMDAHAPRPEPDFRDSIHHP